MLKKAFAGLGAGVLLLAAAACGSGDGDGDGNGDGGGDGDGIVVGFVQTGAESAWRTANTESIRSAAEADDRIAELVFIDGENNPEVQRQGVSNLIQQQVDVIVLSAEVADGWTSVLEEAQDAGIPVVLSDRKIDEADSHLFDAYIGSDFVEEGRKAGQWTVERYADNDTTRILELEGTVGSAPANDRHEGFFEVLDGEGFSYELLDTQSGGFTREGGKAVMETFLDAYSADEIDLLYAHNDDMGLGAIQAMEEAGVAPGVDIEIIIVDGTREGFQAGADGKLNYIVECNPVFGPQLMDVIVDVHNGGEFDADIPVEEGVFGEEDFERELPNRQF